MSKGRFGGTRSGRYALAAATLGLLAALVVPATAAGGRAHDRRDAAGPLDIKRIKLNQSERRLIIRLRNYDRLPRLRVLDRHPKRNDSHGERYLCVQLISRSIKRKLLCPGGRARKGRIAVGVSKVARKGGARPKGKIRAELKRGKRSLRLALKLGDLGLRPGKLRWFGVSGWRGPACAGPGSCLDRAPARGIVKDRIYPLRRVGCSRPRDLAFRNGPRNRKAIALTFDDGPSGYTAKIMRILDRHHAKGTFFALGSQVGGRAGVLRKLLRHGHELANHSTNHSFNPGRGDMRHTNRLIEGATGFEPCLFRPPGGFLSGSTAAAARSLGMASVLWDIDTNDWQLPGSGAIYSRAVQAGPGSIVLMHDGGGYRGQTVGALPRIIRKLRSRGYRLVTVTKLIGGHYKVREDR